ncbi:hypothetical protein ACFSLT_23850 [Novosphingobium resinovorum]
MKWFFVHAYQGHIVILRASFGPEIGEEFYREIGGIRSAETFVFRNRKAAYDPKVIAALHKADGIFIAAAISPATCASGAALRSPQRSTPTSLPSRSAVQARAWRCSGRSFTGRWTVAA